MGRERHSPRLASQKQRGEGTSTHRVSLPCKHTHQVPLPCEYSDTHTHKTHRHTHRHRRIRQFYPLLILLTSCMTSALWVSSPAPCWTDPPLCAWLCTHE